jgi:hypothetical protein
VRVSPGFWVAPLGTESHSDSEITPVAPRWGSRIQSWAQGSTPNGGNRPKRSPSVSLAAMLCAQPSNATACHTASTKSAAQTTQKTQTAAPRHLARPLLPRRRGRINLGGHESVESDRPAIRANDRRAVCRIGLRFGAKRALAAGGWGGQADQPGGAAGDFDGEAGQIPGRQRSPRDSATTLPPTPCPRPTPAGRPLVRPGQFSCWETADLAIIVVTGSA